MAEAGAASREARRAGLAAEEVNAASMSSPGLGPLPVPPTATGWSDTMYEWGSSISTTSPHRWVAVAELTVVGASDTGSPRVLVKCGQLFQLQSGVADQL